MVEYSWCLVINKTSIINRIDSYAYPLIQFIIISKVAVTISVSHIYTSHCFINAPMTKLNVCKIHPNSNSQLWLSNRISRYFYHSRYAFGHQRLGCWINHIWSTDFTRCIGDNSFLYMHDYMYMFFVYDFIIILYVYWYERN